jgi:hypothetical protein
MQVSLFFYLQNDFRKVIEKNWTTIKMKKKHVFLYYVPDVFNEERVFTQGVRLHGSQHVFHCLVHTPQQLVQFGILIHVTSSFSNIVISFPGSNLLKMY